MERAITGFHLDDEGDWVAELACGHNQHVRHRPPFQERPWVIEASGRADRIGTPLDCPWCDRAELPEAVRYVRSTPVWDEDTLPPALRHAHRVGANTWGRITVRDGSLRFRAATSPPLEAVLEAGMTQPIPPEVDHEVAPLGPVHLSIDFLAVSRERPDEGGDSACWAHLVDEESGKIHE